MTQQYQSPQYPPTGIDNRPTSMVAIFSLVLGILFLCLGPLGLVPLILGIVGITKTGERGEKKGMGFAIAGTALGGVAILGTCLSAGILLPAFGAARQQAMLLISQSQVRALQQACVLYAQDNNDQYPTSDQWPQDLIDAGYLDDAFLVSPVDDGDDVNYVYVVGFDPLNPSHIVIYEDPDHWPNQGVVVGFVDGGVEVLPFDVFERMLAEQTGAQP